MNTAALREHIHQQHGMHYHHDDAPTGSVARWLHATQHALAIALGVDPHAGRMLGDLDAARGPMNTIRRVAGILDGPAPTLAKIAGVLLEAGIPVQRAGGRRSPTPPTPCDAVVWHGPGHQSKTHCRIREPHDIDGDHEAYYGTNQQHATRRGPQAMTGPFDEPPGEGHCEHAAGSRVLGCDGPEPSSGQRAAARPRSAHPAGVASHHERGRR